MAGTIEPLGLHEKQTVGRGSNAKIRSDHSGAQVMSFTGTGDFGEAALKGALFSGVSTTNTIAAGNVNAAAAAASTNTGLLNPATSNATVVLLQVTCALQSGTPGVGSLYHSRSTGTTILTSVVGFSRGINAATGAANAQGFVLDSDAGVTLTGSTALTTLSCWGVPLTATAITTSATSPGTLVANVNGSIVLAPGDMYLPTFTAAGTTLIANFGYLWYEVPANGV
jgi:hypothetical protein